MPAVNLATGAKAPHTGRLVCYPTYISTDKNGRETGQQEAELFHRLGAATDGGSDLLMAMGLDANCFAEAQGLRDRYAAPGSGSRSRERWGVP
jgi:hypothetical protein